MDIEVKEFQAPKIVINYEDLKAELEKNLESYKGLVVTEETLAGSKAAQKESSLFDTSDINSSGLCQRCVSCGNQSGCPR